MYKTIKLSGFILLSCALLGSCRSATETPAPPVATALPATPTPLELPTEEDTDVPPPALFDQSWDDRSVYTEGLVPEHQPALDSLPGATIYHLDIQIDEDMALLAGRGEILYTNQETLPLDEIYFRLYPNHFLGEPVKIENLSANGAAVEPETLLADTVLNIPLAEPLSPGELVVVSFDYSMVIPDIDESPYSSFGYGDGLLALDQFYPAAVVFDDGGWSLGDPPQWEDSGYADAGFFLVSLTMPGDRQVVASGVEVGRESVAGSQTLTFAAGPARAFSFIAGGNLEAASATVGNTTINSYSPPELATGARDALAFASQALEAFNARLGTYPYVEYDMVSTLLAASGAASTGLVVINRDYYQPGQAGDVPAFNSLERTVAHELAHQWFYNLVNNDYANELWLAEGFAQYLTGRYYLDAYGEAELETYARDWTARWSQVGLREIPIGLPVGEYGAGEVHAIIYGRAPIFIEALSQEMGEIEFVSFLRNYLSMYRWDITSEEQFKQLAESDCACDLEPFFVEWVYPNADDQTSQSDAEGAGDGRTLVVKPRVPFDVAQESTEFQLLLPVYFPERFEFFGVSLTGSQEAALNYLQTEPSVRLATLVQTVAGVESEFTLVLNEENAENVTINGVEAVWIYDPAGDEGLLEWTAGGIHYRLVGIVDREEALRIAELLE